MSYHEGDLQRPRSQGSDDEKTVRGVDIEHACPEKKEDTSAIDSKDEVQTREDAVDPRSDDDGFPEGGLKAWMVVLGVSTLTSPK